MFTQNFIKILIISLGSTMLFWGAALLPFTTLSATQSQASILPDCRPEPQNLKCHSEFKHSVSGGDPGATLWVTQSISYLRKFLRDQKKPVDAKWSPYIGSGYPLFLDGHHRIESPIELFTSYFPQDQGRDVVSVFRILFFTITILLLINLFTNSTFFLILGALLSATSHYLATMVDITYLDFDCFAPFFIWILLRISLKQQIHKVNYIFASGLSIYLGLQGFVQSFVTYLALLGLSSIVLFYWCPTHCKKHFLKQVAILLFVPLIFQLNYLYQYYKYIEQFLSTRNVFACIAQDSVGLLNYLGISLKWTQDPSTFYLINLASLPIVFFNFKNNLGKKLILFFGVTAAIQIFGLPSLVCKIPLVSGIRFGRHLAAYNNVLSIVVITVGAFYCFEYLMRHKVGPRFTKLTYASILFFTVVPSFHDNYFNYKFAIGKAGIELEPFEAAVPENSPLNQIQKLSQNEDRRHFSPEGILFPNWSQVFKILDMRLLYALYLKDYFTLNGNLSNHWDGDSVQLLKPDRFTKFDSPIEMQNPNVTKMLLLNRVSLLSFKRNQAEFAQQGPYSKEHCQLLAQDENIESYLCKVVGGISYFAEKIYIKKDNADILNQIKGDGIEQVLNAAYVTDTDLGSVGKGHIVAFERQMNQLIYKLDVEKTGLFVITDSYFPAWQALIDEKPTTIFKVNYAFKGILLPAGQHILYLKFKP